MGRSRVAGDDEKGFVIEMLRAGSPAVVAATRPISDRVSGELVREIYSASWQEFTSLPAALKLARIYADKSDMNPVCWSAYVFYGQPKTTLKPRSVDHQPPRAWHQELMRYLASGHEDYRKDTIKKLRSIAPTNITLKDIYERLTQKNSDWGLDTDLVVTNLAQIDFIGALRLRAGISAWRVDTEMARKQRDDNLLLYEIGTGLHISLEIQDAFALVGLARRHFKLFGTIALHEILTILRYTKPLAEAMAEEDPRFSKAAEELARELSKYDDKIIFDVTRVVPDELID